MEEKMKSKKKRWKKPELVVLAKGKLGENVLVPCGYTNPYTGKVYQRSGTTP